jgi:polyisoprenyl-phosphate glycosyltransferase
MVVPGREYETGSGTQMISIVIPAYRSRESLPFLVDGIETVLTAAISDFEIIVVDDCSPDDTWAVLSALKEAGHPRLRIVRLLKNSGQHNALLCGFSLARGDVVITMDDDLQNPPEEIPKLLTAINAGYDLVIGSYDGKKHTPVRNFGGSLIDNVQRRIFKLPEDFQLTSFRAVRRVVIDNVVAMGGAFPYVTSMLLSHAARAVNVPVRHDPRRYGVSNYNLRRSALLACNLLLSYSAYPLYLVMALCIAALGCAGALSLFVLWKAFIDSGTIPGWASTILALSFFSGLILLVLVIHSLYLSRLSQQLTRSRVSFSIGELRD